MALTDRTKPFDVSEIDPDNPEQIYYWSRKLAISAEKLLDTIRSGGRSADTLKLSRFPNPPIKRIPNPGGQPKVILYEHLNYGGQSLPVNSTTNHLPGFFGTNDGQATAFRIYTNEWVIFWEDVNLHHSDDQLWIAPAGVNRGWELPDLRGVGRPHGNNQWNDRIRGIAFSPTGPIGDNQNRTIVYDWNHWSVGT